MLAFNRTVSARHCHARHPRSVAALLGLITCVLGSSTGGCPSAESVDPAGGTVVAGEVVTNPAFPNGPGPTGPAPSDGIGADDGGGGVPIPGLIAPDYHFASLYRTVRVVTLSASTDLPRELKVDIVSPPIHGTLTEPEAVSGSVYEVRYDPGDFVGTAQFSYRVSDGIQESNVGTITIDVIPEVRFRVFADDGPPPRDIRVQAFAVPDAPLPEAEYVWTVGDQTFRGNARTHGAFATRLTAGGVYDVRLVVNIAAVGFAALARAGADGAESSVRVVVWPTVSGRVATATGQAVPNVAVGVSGEPYSATTNEQGNYALALPLGFSGSIAPARNGYTFAPATHAFAELAADAGPVNFTAFQVGGGNNEPAPNRAPTADPQTVSTDEDAAVAVVLSGSDPDGDALRYIVTSLPSAGVLRDSTANRVLAAGDLPYNIPNNARALHFTPAANWYGNSSFSFRASDNRDASGDALVALVVRAVNDDPVIAQSDPTSITVEQNSQANAAPNRITLRAADVDASGNTLAWTISTAAVHGTALVASGSPSASNGNVVVSYQPVTGYTGADSFRVRVTDSAGASDTLLVNVNVSSTTPPGTFYVDANNPNASDTNVGSETLPFRTIQRAANTVNPGDTIYVKAGVYRESITISRNGNATGRIRFLRFQNDAVVVDCERTRQFGFWIGRNAAPGGAHYVTIDGFTIRNMAGGSNSGGVLLYGCTHVEVKNCTIHMENWVAEDYTTGIRINGPTEDILMEGNTIYRMQVGINSRWSPSGDYPGAPKRMTIRNNHVHHMHVNDHLQQNHTFGIAISNMSEDTLIEGNLVHHIDDFCIGTNETGGPTTIRHNICYLADYTDGGGGGNGIKIKPLTGANRGSPFADQVHYNVVFLTKGGIHLVTYPDGRGHRCYNNTSIKNFGNGIDYSTIGPGDDYTTFVKNNLFAYNGARDLPPHPSTPSGALAYNYVEDGWGVNAAAHPYTMTAASHGLPRLVNAAKFDESPDAELTPLFLQPLNDPAQHPTATAALAFARQKMRESAALLSDSPCIDAAANFGLNLPDLFGVTPADYPGRADPWNDGQPGVIDVGAMEYTP